MKKSDNTRSHSWWWDSHISPKNSKWLQENLSEMDSKVNAMLKIIEADADSFAQRAELFYKKRPELVNLVEEFYRTYRALVERYTYLTREIRQNIGPALQAQYGVSTESAQNSPVDLHVKRGLDGPDIISPSYSYTGALEFDNDSPMSDVSAKGHTDDEFSPLAYRSNYERRAFGYKPRYPNMEETSHKASEPGCLHDVTISQLQKEITRLQDENKALINKSTEDVTKLKSLELELSSFQSKVRGLEAEDKLTKKRLKAVQEKEQKLEAENLKLSHSLVSSKEEKSELLEQHNKVIEENKAASKNIELLEDQVVAAKQNFVTAQSQLWDREEHLKKEEETISTLQLAITTLEEERRKDLSLLESLEHQSEELRKRISDHEKRNTGFTEESQTQAAQIKELQDKFTDVVDSAKVLEESLRDSEQAKSIANLKVEELQKELEGAQRAKQDFSNQMQQQIGDIARLNEIICKLEEEGKWAQEEKIEAGKYVLKLETDIKEGQQAAEALLAKVQEEGRAKAELIGKLMSDIDSSQTLLARSREENRILGEDREKWHSDFKAQIHGLERSLSDSKIVNTALAEQMAEKGKRIEQLNHELQGSQEKVIAMNEDIASRTSHALGLHEEINSFRDQVKLLRVELEETSKTKQSLEAFVEGLQQKESESKEAYQTLVHEQQELLNDVLLLQSKNQDFESNLSHLTGERAKLLEEAATHIEQSNGMKERIMILERDYEALQIQIGSLQDQLQKFEEEKQLMEEEDKSLSKKLFEAEGRVQDLQLKVSNLLCEQAALAEQNSERNSKIQSLEVALFGLQEDNASLSEDAGLLQRQLSAFKTREASLLAEMHDSSDLVQFLKAEIEKLQQEVLKAEEKENHFALEQKKNLDECLVMRQKVENLQRDLGLIGEDNIFLTRDLQAREIANHSEPKNELDGEVQKLEAQKGTLQQELLLVQHMADQLQEELKGLLEERKQNSSILDSQKMKLEQREEDLRRLQSVLGCTKEELQSNMDKLNLLTEEKVALLQEMKESKHEAERLRENFLKLETEFNELQQMKVATETKLGGMMEDVKRQQEDALILQTAKLELEQHLELSSRQVDAQMKEVGALQGMVAVAQQEKATLGSLLEDAERRVMAVSEECHQQKESCKALTEELAAVLALKQQLEEDFAEEQAEKAACTQKLDKIQEDLICMQEQKEQLVLNLEVSSLEVQKSEAMLSTLQVLLDSAEKAKLELAEKQSKMSLDWNASERMLLEEISNLKSASLLEKEESSLQHDHVLRLEEEIGNLQAERKALQNDKALNMNEIVTMQDQINGLQNELLEKQEKILNLSVQVDTLQKSFISIEQENADLRELLQKDKECHGAAEKALKDALCLVQDEVASKGKQVIELCDTLSGLEKKNDTLVEGMSLNESTKVELQKEAQHLREVIEGLTHKLQDSDTQFGQVQTNLKLLEAELHELHERQYKLNDENKSKESCYQAQAQEHTLFKEQVKELTGALSNLQTENRTLKVEHAHEFSALSHELLVLKEEKGEAVKKAGLVGTQVITLQELLVQAKGDSEFWKRQAEVAAEEVSCLKTEIQGLLSTISDLNRQCLQWHEKVEHSVTNLNLAQQELAAARDENIKLGELVSDGTRSARNFQEQVSSLNDSKKNLEGALDVVTRQLKDSQMMLDNTERSQQASLHGLQGHSQLLFQIVSRIEDLDEMLNLSPTNRQALIRGEAMGSQENGLENSNIQGGDLQEPISSLDSANKSHLPEAIHDHLSSTGKRPFSFHQHSKDNCSQQKSSVSNEPMETRNASSSGLMTSNVNENSMFGAGLDAIDRLKEKVLILLKKDISPEVQSVASSGEHVGSVEEQQEDLSHFQQQIEHLTFEVSLYKKDISCLKEIFEGNKLQEDGKIANAEVKPLLHAWKDSLMKSEEKSRGIQKETELAMIEKQNVQLMLSDLQVKVLTYAVLLRENVLLTGKEIKLLVGEWDKRICSNGSTERIEKLDRLEKSCTSSDLDGEGSSSAADVLKQLKKRVEEVILLREAVEGMLPSAYWQDHSKEEEESELSSTTGAGKLIMPMDKHQEKQHGWSFSSGTDRMDSELDMDAVGSIGNLIPDRGDEIVETDSFDQAEKIDLIEGIARRLHINLGTRLHQALMDEKLENELQELKEERKQLEEGLKTRVEQVQRMEAELDRLQGILREGREESEMLDLRQQQQWLQRKKRALKKARKLSKQLVQRRRQVGNMQDALATWVEQQELATKILEDQVLLLVDQEIAPTMEGWDVGQVNKLMEEMQSRKALTRRHSMDLHSVGQKLQKVGTSIERTHMQLLRKEEQELVESRIGNETVPVDASRTVEDQQKLSRFGLAWLLLLFGTNRKDFSRSSRSSTPSTAPGSSIQRKSRRARSGAAMRSLVAQTRKMGCCACGSKSHALKSSDDK